MTCPTAVMTQQIVTMTECLRKASAITPMMILATALPMVETVRTTDVSTGDRPRCCFMNTTMYGCRKPNAATHNRSSCGMYHLKNELFHFISKDSNQKHVKMRFFSSFMFKLRILYNREFVALFVLTSGRERDIFELSLRANINPLIGH